MPLISIHDASDVRFVPGSENERLDALTRSLAALPTRSSRNRSTTSQNPVVPNARISATGSIVRWLCKMRRGRRWANSFATVSFPTAGGP
jgi:hypothetical protein